jgi:hypothetical protein
LHFFGSLGYADNLKIGQPDLGRRYIRVQPITIQLLPCSLRTPAPDGGMLDERRPVKAMREVRNQR